MGIETVAVYSTADRDSLHVRFADEAVCIGAPAGKDSYLRFDRIIAAGGYISVRTGSAQDANALPIAKEDAELAMDAAACIGCGACVAACPNASASLFTAAKIAQFARLPQGQPEREARALRMVAT